MRKLSEKIKTRVLCSVNFAKNGALYEILWKNMDDADRPQTTTHCGAEKMRFASRITKARTHTHNYNV
jgi:hypothetical protein